MTTKLVTPFIYLASQSPRRGQLLDQLGVRHALLLPDADEDAEALEHVLPGEAPSAYVQRVTQLKLDAALLRMKQSLTVGAPAVQLPADSHSSGHTATSNHIHNVNTLQRRHRLSTALKLVNRPR